MVSRILLSQIPIFFHQNCCLFWSPQNAVFQINFLSSQKNSWKNPITNEDNSGLVKTRFVKPSDEQIIYFYYLEIFLRFNCFPNWSHRSSLWAMIQFSCFRINFLSCNFSLTGISSKHSWPSDTIIKAQKWSKLVLCFIHLLIFLKTILCQYDSLFHQLSQNIIIIFA